MPPPHDGVERLFLAHSCSRGGHLNNRDCHGGVVGPFAWLPAEAAASHHGDLEAGGRGVDRTQGGTQGVTGCGAEQDADGTVKLSGCQFHVIGSPFTH